MDKYSFAVGALYGRPRITVKMMQSYNLIQLNRLRRMITIMTLTIVILVIIILTLSVLVLDQRSCEGVAVFGGDTATDTMPQQEKNQRHGSRVSYFFEIKTYFESVQNVSRVNGTILTTDNANHFQYGVFTINTKQVIPIQKNFEGIVSRFGEFAFLPTCIRIKQSDMYQVEFAAMFLTKRGPLKLTVCIYGNESPISCLKRVKRRKDKLHFELLNKLVAIPAETTLWVKVIDMFNNVIAIKDGFFRVTT